MIRARIEGRKPDCFSYTRTRKYARRAVIQFYELVTGDSFEEGDGYSLHRTFEDAEDFYHSLFEWYRKTGSPDEVFVSKSTLGRIIRSKEGGIMRVWEN